MCVVCLMVDVCMYIFLSATIHLCIQAYVHMCELYHIIKYCNINVYVCRWMGVFTVGTTPGGRRTRCIETPDNWNIARSDVHASALDCVQCGGDSSETAHWIGICIDRFG